MWMCKTGIVSVLQLLGCCSLCVFVLLLPLKKKIKKKKQKRRVAHIRNAFRTVLCKSSPPHPGISFLRPIIPLCPTNSEIMHRHISVIPALSFQGHRYKIQTQYRGLWYQRLLYQPLFPSGSQSSGIELHSSEPIVNCCACVQHKSYLSLYIWSQEQVLVTEDLTQESHFYLQAVRGKRDSSVVLYSQVGKSFFQSSQCIYIFWVKKGPDWSFACLEINLYA